MANIKKSPKFGRQKWNSSSYTLKVIMARNSERQTHSYQLIPPCFALTIMTDAVVQKISASSDFHQPLSSTVISISSPGNNPLWIPLVFFLHSPTPAGRHICFTNSLTSNNLSTCVSASAVLLYGFSMICKLPFYTLIFLSPTIL